MEKILLEKKEKLFRNRDISKWGMNEFSLFDESELLNNKKLAF